MITHSHDNLRPRWGTPPQPNQALPSEDSDRPRWGATPSPAPPGDDNVRPWWGTPPPANQLSGQQQP